MSPAVDSWAYPSRRHAKLDHTVSEFVWVLYCWPPAAVERPVLCPFFVINHLVGGSVGQRYGTSKRSEK